MIHGRFFISILSVVLLLSGCGKLIAPSGNYDLTSKSITYLPNPVKVGDEVVFTYTVDNIGKSDVPAKTYDVDFYVNGKRVSFDHATSLIPSGLKTTYSMAKGYYHFKASKPGKYIYMIVIDPNNRLKEFNETNNVVQGVIEVTE